MFTIHLHTSEEKIDWWGYGEWVEEPDFCFFFRSGFHCRILRLEEGFLSCSVVIHHFHPIYDNIKVLKSISLKGEKPLVEKNYSGIYVGFIFNGDTYANIDHCAKKCAELAREVAYANECVKNIYVLD